VAWGAVSLAVIQLVGLNLDWAMLARENSSIQREQRVLAERALPANSAIVDPPWQVAERLRTLQTVSGATSPNSVVGLLGRLSQAWPQLGNIRIRTLIYEGGALSASIDAVDNAWLEQLKTAAEAQGLTVSSQDESDKGEGIRLSFRAAGKEGSHGQ